MSVGTLLAFTVVAISILILRYVPPNEVPLPSSFHESIHSVSSRYNLQEKIEESPQDETYSVQDAGPNIPLVNEDSFGNYWVVCVNDGKMNNVSSANVAFPYSLFFRSKCFCRIFFLMSSALLEDQNRRKMAALSILSICVGVLVVTSMASFAIFPM